MKARSCILHCCVLVLICVLAGCLSGRTTVGNPLNQDKVGLIKPKVTTFSEILTLLGPPDYIVDGTKSVMDEEAFYSMFATMRVDPNADDYPETPVSTRVLTAPDGMVLLIYRQTVMRETTVARRLSLGIRPGELFIYLSKKDRTVITLTSSHANTE